MSDIYGEFQDIAAELIGEFQQGTVVLIQPGEPTGPAWNPQPGDPVEHSVNAVVSGVPESLVDGSLIVATDLLVTIPGDAVPTRPSAADWRVNIDGVAHEIVKVMQIPAAGTPVTYRLAVRA